MDESAQYLMEGDSESSHRDINAEAFLLLLILLLWFGSEAD